MSYRNIEVRKVTPRLGAEIHGVDLSQELEEDTLAEIRRALVDNQVIFFRDQDMTLDQHKAFGRRFGELHVHPAAKSPEGHPEVLPIHADEHSRYVAGEAWHTDVSCDEEPPMASILRLHTVPECGGDTLFSSMYAAYDALSPRMKEFLKSCKAVHSGEHVYRGYYQTGKGQREDTQNAFPEHEHPVIRTHPESGRQSLYVNSGFTTRIVGLNKDESDALLKFLFNHIAQPQFHCRFNWRKNSIAFWDNRCVQHYAMWDYYPEVRSGYRVTIKGDRPYFDSEGVEGELNLAPHRRVRAA
ncbi:TauD/TfdA dioxygenase family protein [Alloalcanivorax mobilis]|uniref:TauD/TfdA dioxygenase family protein n=1 Tax=Alloalcanivorax mobilis TaxID=2019569 RepID=UPI000C77453E|nr:TauD/TfdA family dioxygenase [Alloalcanivorax mobilis]